MSTTDKLFYIGFGLIFGFIITMFLTINHMQELRTDKLYLIEKVQEQKEDIRGFEQMIKQYEENPCTDVILLQSSSLIKSSN